MNSYLRSDSHLSPPYDNIELLPFDGLGWFPQSSATILKSIIKRYSIRTIVEAGCYFGLSTRYMAKLLPEGGKIYAVDHWLNLSELTSKIHLQDFLSDTNHRNIKYAADRWLSKTDKLYQQFLSNVIHENLTKVIIPLRMLSVDGAKYLSTTQIDLAYIDAGHDKESVHNDLTAYYPLIQGSVLDKK